MRAARITICLLFTPLLTASSQLMNTGGGRPSVSPDGNYITYSAARNGEWEIYVIHPDGTGVQQLTQVHEKNFVNLGPPTWINGSVLVWRRVNDTTRASLVALSPSGDGTNATGRPQLPGVEVPFDALQIRPSPDGRTLVFIHGNPRAPRVGVVNIDGTGLRDLTDGKNPGINPDWSPDSKRIAFTTIDSASHGQIAVVDRDGSNLRVVTHIDPAEGLPQWANWAPDGKRLVIQAGKYNRAKIEESTAHLWIVDVATGTAKKLAPHTNFSLDETPSWFPDGKHIAFQSNRTGTMHVWIMNDDGTSARQVTRLPP